MSLKTYRKKRNFRRTPEPRGRRTRRHGALLYVIQKHAATRLHYDLRLEVDGVLKSWAVPKGPSLDPSKKRLAVQVEDHPIDYGAFEGVIPEEEYGGGSVLVWDRGSWTPEGDPSEGLRRGRLKFHLEGEKLKGGWVLVRLRKAKENGGKANWLLFKEKDGEARARGRKEIVEARPESVASGRRIEEIGADGNGTPPARRDTKRGGRGVKAPRTSGKRSRTRGAARKAPGASRRRAGARTRVPVPGAKRAALPDRVEPELATLVERAPEGNEWFHEIKFDGYRILMRLAKGRARFITRGGKDWTDRFAALAGEAADLPAASALIDGEVVATDAKGRSSFQKLQEAFRNADATPLLFYAFDLLYLDGRDLTALPLCERKEALARLLGDVSDSSGIRYSDHVVGRGPEFFRQACRKGLEGVVSKRADAPYRTGRGRAWLKTKCLHRQEFVIGGYVGGQRSRDRMGALLLGVYDDGGGLSYAGKVGTGFSEETIDDLLARFKSLAREASPFAKAPAGPGVRGARWLEPKLVAEVTFTEWTRDGMLRHPSFEGLREDKRPREIRREKPIAASVAAHSKRGNPSRRGGKATGAETTSREEPTSVAGVALTNPERVLYPQQGLRKIDLAAYYEEVAERMLPHVAGRPLSLVRCPQGVRKSCFYQKHLGEEAPEAVGRVEIEEEKGTVGVYPVIENVAGLVALVQIGVLEIHTWGARADSVDKPDRLVFDLDPDAGLPWKRVVDAAHLVRTRLEEMSLQSWIKTTGGKGLHVVVPIERRYGWDEVRAFCRALAEACVAQDPDRLTVNPIKARRKGKVFIDYLRNARGATSVAPYSTRARERAPVSTPIRWDELGSKIGPSTFHVGNIPERVARLDKDPWQGIDRARQRLPAGAR